MTETNDALNGSARRMLRRALGDWEGNELAAFIARQPEGREEYETAYGLAVKRVYTAVDGVRTPLDDIGLPGRYPFTRGPHLCGTLAPMGRLADGPLRSRSRLLSRCRAVARRGIVGMFACT